MTSSELKAKAREALNGKKKNAAIMLLVYFVALSIVSSVLKAIFPGETQSMYFEGVGNIDVTSTSPIASLINSFVSLYLSLGFLNYFMKLARGEEVSIKDVFIGTKVTVVLKFFVTSILTGILVMLGCVALIIPGIIIAYMYTMVTYIYLDNPEIGITEVMKKSREMMKGHKWQYFCLMFSFIGWILLLIPTLGILSFWLIPYMNVTQVMFYDSIKE